MTVRTSSQSSRLSSASPGYIPKLEVQVSQLFSPLLVLMHLRRALLLEICPVLGVGQKRIDLIHLLHLKCRDLNSASVGM